MRSLQLERTLNDYVRVVAGHLRGELAAGAEVPFEVGSRVRSSARAATPLYCYRALTGAFISEREDALSRLPGHAEAAKLLESFDGLERYLAARGTEVSRATGPARADAAVRALLEDVFDEQSDFQVRPERVRAALERLQHSASAGAGHLAVVATLHGLTIASDELLLTRGLTIAQPDALEGLPPQAHSAGEGELRPSSLVVLYTAEEDDPADGLAQAKGVLADVLRGLRLFGEAHVTLGALAWVRIGAGTWNPLALTAGGAPRGTLVVTADQEDELRAFCNLVSRRSPRGDELAWALRRFELGCERDSPHEALTDYLLALRALLEPEGPASGYMAGRLGALCATPPERAALTQRTADGAALERTIISGGAVKIAVIRAHTQELGGHLRALLSDLICGHLDRDLPGLADRLLTAPDEVAAEPAEQLTAGEHAAQLTAEPPPVEPAHA